MVPVSQLLPIEFLLGLFLVFVRIMAFFAVAPIFGQNNVPAPLRVSLAMVLTVFIADKVQIPESLETLDMTILILQQIIVGLSVGFLTKILFTAFELAGEAMSMQMGLSFSQFIDPIRGSMGSTMSSFVALIASMLFLSMNGHLLLLAAMFKTYQIVPISMQLDVIDYPVLFEIGTEFFAIGLHIALPVMIVLLLSNLVFGIVSKSAPSMQVISYAFPVTITLGMVMLYFIIPNLGEFIQQTAESLLTKPILLKPAQ